MFSCKRSLSPFLICSPSLTRIAVILPNPCACMFVYVVGLISPEAVTIETRLSCFATFAVWTVTTPLLAAFRLYITIPPMTTTAPTPIATLCHVFILTFLAYLQPGSTLSVPAICRGTPSVPCPVLPHFRYGLDVLNVSPLGTTRRQRDVVPVRRILPWGKDPADRRTYSKNNPYKKEPPD